jgi:hypothetical protein
MIEEDNVQTPFVEVTGASAAVVVRVSLGNCTSLLMNHQCQPLIQPFRSKSSGDSADARGLLALGRYLAIGILPNITVNNRIGRMHGSLFDAKVGLLAFWFVILDAALFLTIHWKDLVYVQTDIFDIFAARMWEARLFVLITGAVVLVSVIAMILFSSGVWWQPQTTHRLSEGYTDKAIHYY